MKRNLSYPIHLLFLLSCLFYAVHATDILDNDLTSRDSSPASSCGTENWSGPSAWWFIFTLAISCIAHPRGSLVFNRSGRIWRLSPVYLVIEDISIVRRLGACLWIHPWKWRALRTALRRHSYAILALREGNTWSQDEYDTFFGEGENVRFLIGEDGGNGEGDFKVEVEAEGLEMTGETVQGHTEHSESSSSTLVRRSTVELENGASHHSPTTTTRNISRSSMQKTIRMADWFTIGTFHSRDFSTRLSPESEGKTLTINKTALFLSARFRRNIEQVEDYEKGPAFRLLLWFPIVQQLCRACFVSGASWTMGIGSIFWISFGLIEILLFVVRKPLDRKEKERVVMLMRKWGDMEGIDLELPWSERERKMGIVLRPKWNMEDPVWFDIAPVWIALAAVSNFMLFCRIYKFGPIYQLFGELLWITWSTGLDGLFDWLTEDGWWYRWPLVLVAALLAAVASLMVSLTIIMMYIFFTSLGVFVPVFVSAIAARALGLADHEALRHAPAFTAMTTAILTFVMYFGLGSSGGLSFDCSTTWKSPIYDYLG